VGQEEYRIGAASVIDLVADAVQSEIETKKRLTFGTRWRCFSKERKSPELNLSRSIACRALLRASKRLKRNQQQCQFGHLPTYSSSLTVPSKGGVQYKFHSMSGETNKLLTRYWALSGGVRSQQCFLHFDGRLNEA
jgi:hypothetical protein